MPKDRPIEKVDAYFGDFTKQIAERIKSSGKVRILDAGCGYGVAMMGFIKRFGDKVEIVGYNYSKKDGDVNTAKREAIKQKIFTKQEINKLNNLPKFLYFDASKKLPFKDNSFDFIYSMASIYLYDDKIHFLEECNRILRKDGLARISPSFNMDPNRIDTRNAAKKKSQYFMKHWEVWDKGKEIQIQDYVKGIAGVKAVWENKYHGDKPFYLEIKKQKKIDFKLRLVASIDTNLIWRRWGGVKSIYTTQLEGDFKPMWKVK